LRSKHFICLKIIVLSEFYLTNRAVRLESFCSVLLYLLTTNSDPATHSHMAVNWLGAPRCLRQMKRCSEQEETTSVATRSSSSVAPYHSFPPLAKTHSLRTSSSPPKASLFGHPCKATMSLTERVVDLSPMGAQKQKILSKDGIFCFIQYLSLVKWGKFPMICTFKAFFGKIVLNKAQLNILMSRV
jgi:hypothetical protein